MARQETTFEKVAAAAADLHKKGRPVTVEAVSEALDGAPATDVYRHLSVWRAEHLKAAPPPKADIPKPLLEELAKWARQYAEDAAAPARATLAQAESDLEALRGAGESLEAEREALQAEVADLALARSEAAAEIAERDETIERLGAELRDAKQVAMDALVSKAKDQLAIDGKENQLAALRAEVERHMAAQSAE